MDGPAPADIWETAKQAGPFGMLIMLAILAAGYRLYQNKHAELVARDSKWDEMLERVVTALESSARATSAVGKAMEERNRAADAQTAAVAELAREVAYLRGQTHGGRP